MGDLTPGQQSALDSADGFLEAIEQTPMTRSYKMLLLKALLRLDRIPGEISVVDLARDVGKIAATSSKLRSDLSVQPEDLPAVQNLLKKDPIAAWTGGRGTKGKAYFESSEYKFRSTFSVPAAERESFRELTREVVEWRLAEYLGPLEESEETESVEKATRPAG